MCAEPRSTEGSGSADVVAATLRHRVLTGALVPGDRLNDTRLAASFGVSRNTMRDAIRVLQFEGLAEARPHAGAVVRVLTEADIADIYAVRRVLELAAVQESVAAPTSSLDALVVLAHQAQALVDREAWAEVNTLGVEFHRELVNLIGSDRTIRFFNVTLAQLRLAFALLPAGDAFHGRWANRDVDIAEALRSGRRDRAADLLRAYLDDSYAEVIDALRRRSLMASRQ